MKLNKYEFFKHFPKSTTCRFKKDRIPPYLLYVTSTP